MAFTKVESENGRSSSTGATKARDNSGTDGRRIEWTAGRRALARPSGGAPHDEQAVADYEHLIALQDDLTSAVEAVPDRPHKILDFTEPQIEDYEDTKPTPPILTSTPSSNQRAATGRRRVVVAHCLQLAKHQQRAQSVFRVVDSEQAITGAARNEI